LLGFMRSLQIERGPKALETSMGSPHYGVLSDGLIL
jgi:hypothetical protein